MQQPRESLLGHLRRWTFTAATAVSAIATPLYFTSQLSGSFTLPSRRFPALLNPTSLKPSTTQTEFAPFQNILLEHKLSLSIQFRLFTLPHYSSRHLSTAQKLVQALRINSSTKRRARTQSTWSSPRQILASTNEAIKSKTLSHRPRPLKYTGFTE